MVILAPLLVIETEYVRKKDKEMAFLFRKATKDTLEFMLRKPSQTEARSMKQCKILLQNLTLQKSLTQLFSALKLFIQKSSLTGDRQPFSTRLHLQHILIWQIFAS